MGEVLELEGERREISLARRVCDDQDLDVPVYEPAFYLDNTTASTAVPETSQSDRREGCANSEEYAEKCKLDTDRYGGWTRENSVGYANGQGNTDERDGEMSVHISEVLIQWLTEELGSFPVAEHNRRIWCPHLDFFSSQSSVWSVVDEDLDSVKDLAGGCQ